jgi:Flp pilus assembly protein TadG
MPANRSRRARRRPGRLAIELLLILPVLLALLGGLIEFSVLLVARQQLANASRQGARVAALGGDAATVEQAARLALGSGAVSAATVVSVLTDDTGVPLPSGAAVQVTVQVPAASVAPNMLGVLGFSLGDRLLAAVTVMRKE